MYVKEKLVTTMIELITANKSPEKLKETQGPIKMTVPSFSRAGPPFEIPNRYRRAVISGHVDF